jgi:hypothetical protein
MWSIEERLEEAHPARHPRKILSIGHTRDSTISYGRFKTK